MTNDIPQINDGQYSKSINEITKQMMYQQHLNDIKLEASVTKFQWAALQVSDESRDSLTARYPGVDPSATLDLALERLRTLEQVLKL